LHLFLYIFFSNFYILRFLSPKYKVAFAIVTAVESELILWHAVILYVRSLILSEGKYTALGIHTVMKIFPTALQHPTIHADGINTSPAIYAVMN
jgi:hypothetical protein